MKKLCLLMVLLLAPTMAWAQGTINVSNVFGHVEVRSASSRAFVPLSAAIRQVRAGDEIRTGDGGTATLTLPDGSYMVVTPNSTVQLQDYWSSGLRSIANVLMGKVRFYIQKFGGAPNPYRAVTPTALIAVRGTTFDVTVDDALWTEVACLEGQVGVETIGLPNSREVLLDPGKKTQVRPGQNPLMPIDIATIFPNRQFQVVNKNQNAIKMDPSMAIPAGVGRDNDRGNRVPGLGASPNSTVEPTISRAKGTLSFPE